MSEEIKNIKLRIAELDVKREQNVLEMAHINKQIDDAKANKQMNGIHSDKHWLSSAKYALKLKGSVHQKMLLERGELARELKILQQKDVNKELLSEFKLLVADKIGEDECFNLFRKAVNKINQ